tara:strand:+ start:376 stop:480 length:105 start_codon:yes stop_codon:yes gene_type:complete
MGIGVAIPLNNEGEIRLIYENVDDADLVSVKYNF